MKKLILFIAFLFVASTTYGQSVSKISGRCQSPYQSQYEVIQAIAAGDLYYVPCPTRSSVFFGLVDFSNATVSGLPFTVSPLTTKGDLWGFSTVNARVPVGVNGQVLTADSTQALGVKWANAPSGSGTLNTVAKWTSGTALGNSLITDDGTNVAIATAAGKTTQIGGGNPNGFSSGASQTVVGDWNGITNGTSLTINDTTQTLVTDAASTFSTNTVTPLTIAGSKIGTALKPFATVNIGGAANTASIITSNATANRAVTLPDAAGTINLGTGTTNTLPKFTGTGTIGNSSFTDDGTNLTARISTQAAGFRTLLGFISDLGDFASAGNGTLIRVHDTAKSVAITTNGSDGTLDISAMKTISMLRTITAAGTTGNQTINKPQGSVNIAAGNSSIVITNSTVTTSSLVNAVANTNDATCSVKNAVPTANTITITMTAACTAETRVGFFVWN